MDFWENRRRNAKIAFLPIPPFFDRAGLLLYQAADLWHEWGLKRSKELKECGYLMMEGAQMMRRNGLGWLGSSEKLEEDAGHLLSSFCFHRQEGIKLRKPDEKEPPRCPEAVPYLVHAAFLIMEHCVPMFKVIAKEEYTEAGWAPKLFGIMEKLAESPCIGSRPVITDETLHALGIQGVLLECQGLAYTQAHIEDSYTESAGKKKRKKASRSDEEIHRMAADIGVDFDVLKDVLETESSPWWREYERYEKEAMARNAGLVFSGDDAIDEIIRQTVNDGYVDCGSHYKCYREETLADCEAVIKTIIASMLAFEGKVSGRPKRLTAHASA